MGCQPVEGAYELYLLGALGDKEHAEIEAHVQRRCRHCLGELQEAAETVYWLAQSIPSARPSASVKSRLLRRLNGPNRRG